MSGKTDRRQKDVASEITETFDIDFRSVGVVRRQTRFIIIKIGFSFVDEIAAELLRVGKQNAGIELIERASA